MTRTSTIPKEHVDEFCRRWKVTTMTADRLQAKPQNDLNLSLKFDPQAEWNLMDRIKMQDELQTLSGRDVHIQNRLVSAHSNGTQHVLFDA